MILLCIRGMSDGKAVVGNTLRTNLRLDKDSFSDSGSLDSKA